MKIYSAGIRSTKDEEGLVKICRWRLYSFFYITKTPKIFDIVTKALRSNTEELGVFIDSGAYSAHTQGTEISIENFVQFLYENDDVIDVFANLDDISCPNKTLKNQKILEGYGLNPLPCFHYGEDIKYLVKYMDNYEYLAIGGMVPVSSAALIPWLDGLFRNYLCNADGSPRIKLHGFGLTTMKLLQRYPWYSVDSTSWLMTSNMGGVYIPYWKNGAWAYDKSYYKVSFGTKIGTDHYKKLSKSKQDLVLRYLSENGERLGGRRSRGVNNSYIRRGLLNARFMVGLEDYLNNLPMTFNHMKRGFR